jgi:diguanylate cyclase (GGDEF)-like protein
MIVRAFAGELTTVGNECDSARRDPLTGLPDREFLMARLAILLKGERVADRHFAVVFLDLDNFKQVNDDFGHLIGDNVLREAARRIAGCLRDGDHVVRYGGDEFVALIHGVTTVDDVEPVVGRVHLALSTPIAISDGEVSLSLSAGVALASEAGGSPEELLAAADRAMYAAKRTGAQFVAGVCDPGCGPAR